MTEIAARPDRAPLAAAPPGPFEPDRVYQAFTAFAEGRGLRLYPAQEEGVIEILSGHHLILSTPTGSGKSLVAVGAHFAAVAQGQRSYYTAPLKALVSEKFFALVEVFGAGNVGMLTGDSSVNPNAPIICCTAEILANLALRRGPHAPVHQVVMDEFHFYSDPERGWAWQVPLLGLSSAQFVLMSATLGDVSSLAADLERRTGRAVASVTGVDRPVPLHHYYATEPIHESIQELLDTGQAPVYVVHFSQAAAVERAQALLSSAVAGREQRDRIAEAIGGFRFGTGFGKTLSRLLRAGIGVHHAGMLPKYRRLVEQLAQRGLLRVISGTDTLGVGINVPIRTVLISALTKFDGSRMRQLTAREFHQIAGRAGRAGYDTAGTVVVQAPEHESENLKALQKAGDDPKKRRKVVRKKAPEGFVSWGQASFERLQNAQPETLTSSMRLTAAMLINVIARGGDVLADARALIFDNHEPRPRQYQLARRALGLYRTLKAAGVVRVDDGQVRLTVDLQPDFALNQPLSPFALAAIELIDTDPSVTAGTGHYALDLISVIEATLDDPRPVLSQQQSRARAQAVAEMKAEGLDYEQRVALLEQISHPRPLMDLLDQAYETFARSQPWVLDFSLAPKSVVRDMYERAMNFTEYVSHYQLARSEGLLLRYLSDAYRAARQTIPEERKTDELRDLIEWLGETVRQVDSSLLDEWERMVNPTDPEAPPPIAPDPPSVLDNRRAFTVLVRNELFRRVQLAALERDDELNDLDPEVDWSAALDAYYSEHDSIGTGPVARAGIILTEEPDRWVVRQILDDPAGDHDWGIEAEVDLAASAEAGSAVIRVHRVGRL